MPRPKKDFSEYTDEECAEMAFAKVVRSASAREQSTLKMRRKLEDAGFPEGAVESALARAQRMGAIDDVRYSECLVRSAIAQGKGLGLALKEIESLGVDPYSLESYREHLEEGEDAEVERALDLLRRRPPKAKDRRGAAYRRLVSKGYSPSVASTASRLFVEEGALP